MKKSLFLLPLLAVGLAVCGCDNNNGGGGTPTPGGGGGGQQGGGGGGTGGGGGGQQGGGDAKSLALTLNFDKISTAIEEAGATGTGYAAVGSITEIDGFEVSFENVCINMLNSKSTPKWTTPSDEKVNVLQFKNPTNGKGIITFSNVKCSKVTVNLLSSYDVDNDFTVSLGGKSSSLKSDAGASTDYKSVSGDKSFDIKKYALSFELSGEGDLVINNNGKGARYVDSIVIE